MVKLNRKKRRRNLKKQQNPFITKPPRRYVEELVNQHSNDSTQHQHSNDSTQHQYSNDSTQHQNETTFSPFFKLTTLEKQDQIMYNHHETAMSFKCASTSQYGIEDNSLEQPEWSSLKN